MTLKGNPIRITKKEFYSRGGFGNPQLYRKADKRGIWKYYIE